MKFISCEKGPKIVTSRTSHPIVSAPRWIAVSRQSILIQGLSGLIWSKENTSSVDLCRQEVLPLQPAGGLGAASFGMNVQYVPTF